MRFYPTKIHLAFSCYIFLAILVLLSCSKDSDLLRDAILHDSIVGVEEQEEKNEEVALPEAETTEEPVVPEMVESNLESRTTSFSPTNDAHIQSATGKGYNQSIIRLEEGNRTSYLMFDLSAIAEIDAEITEATLQFTIHSDNGNGNITVYKGKSSDWTEESLTESNIPGIDVELGSITKEYPLGATETIELNTENLVPEISTLIMDHQDGNDLAFASKEHTSKIGPKLVVKYNAPVDAEEIVPFEEEPQATEVVENPESPSEQPVNEEPMAVADGTPSAGKAPLEVTFSGSNSSDDNEITGYVWDFKDGSTSTQANPKHTFTENGTYEVELTVEDEQGLSSTDTVTITVTEEENEAPVAVISANPKSGEAPLEVTFRGSDSTDDNNVSSYAWNFKDGSTSTNANPQHTFDEAGTYQVELTVKDENGLSDKETVTITVSEPQNEAPVAVVSANKTSGEAPLAVQFTGDKSTDDKKVTSYAWNFKDGSNSTSANPSHTFDAAGTYVVELTVKDEEGLSNKKTITITVTAPNNNPPNANGSSNVTSGEAPLTVNFRGDASTDDNEITSYTWNFKDGSTSTEVNPSHTFENPGTYRVELTVTDANGASDTDTDTITVTAPSNSGGGSTGGGSNGSYPSNAVFASSFGFKAGDATSALRNAINSPNSFIVVDKQSSDWVVGQLAFHSLSNKTIVFESGVVLRAKSGAYSVPQSMLQIKNSSNITILGYGATFKMNKSEYTSGEHRHCLALISVTDVTVKGLTFADSGGDGVYISRTHDGGYSRNILVEDIVSTNNRRQGMSVISVDGLTVRNSTFKNTIGTAPGAGIDFEPPSTRDRLRNIRIENCNFTDNWGPGILLAMSHTSSSTMPLDITFKDVYLSNNFSSSNDGEYPTEIDLGMSVFNRTNPIKGTVTFDGLRVENSKWGAIWSKKTLEAYNVVVKNAVIKNVSKSSNKAAIHIGLLNYGNKSYANMGGWSFQNVLIDYDGVDPSLELFGPGHGNWNLRNMTGQIRVKSPNGIRLHDNLNRLPNSGSTVTLKVVED